MFWFFKYFISHHILSFYLQRVLRRTLLSMYGRRSKESNALPVSKLFTIKISPVSRTCIYLKSQENLLILKSWGTEKCPFCKRLKIFSLTVNASLLLQSLEYNFICFDLRIPGETSPVCSDQGVCECGECICDPPQVYMLLICCLVDFIPFCIILKSNSFDSNNCMMILVRYLKT